MNFSTIFGFLLLGMVFMMSNAEAKSISEQPEAEIIKIDESSVVTKNILVDQGNNESSTIVEITIGLEEVAGNSTVKINKLRVVNDALSTMLREVENDIAKVSKELEEKNELLQATLDAPVKELIKFKEEAALREDKLSSAVKNCMVNMTDKPSKADGYIEKLGIGSYKLYTDPHNWYEAREKCDNDGAHLVIINSDEEADHVKNIIMDANTRLRSTPFWWIGFTVHTGNEAWTIFGESLSEAGYDKWKPGERKEDKYLNACGTFQADHFLNYAPCENYRGFVCELYGL